jgi:hypothetical protein
MIKWVLVNTTYGGFGFSDEFKRAFLERHPDKSHVLEEARDARVRARSDDDIVAFVREFGPDRASGECARIGAEPVFEELLCVTRIHEYDGLESINICTERLFMNLLKEIMEAEGPVDVEEYRGTYRRLKDLVRSQDNLSVTFQDNL